MRTRENQLKMRMSLHLLLLQDLILKVKLTLLLETNVTEANS